nr:MAG TPA: hypothetical protein [Caudoviricetes sp.]
MVGGGGEPMLTAIVPDMEVGSISVSYWKNNWNHVSGNLDGSVNTETIPIRVIDRNRYICLSFQVGAGLRDSRNVSFVSNEELQIVDYSKDALIFIDWR